MTGHRDPWERRDDETPPAYAAFRVYLDQGPARSVTKVAEECHKSRSLIGRWSSRHRWRSRADAWDAHLTTAYRAEVVDAQRTLAHRHLAVSRVALEKVAAAVALVDPGALKVAELARLWDVAARVEREALQVPTRVEVSGPSGSPVQVIAAMTDEERRGRLLALRREVDARLDEHADHLPDDGQEHDDPDDGESTALDPAQPVAGQDHDDDPTPHERYR